MCTVDDERSVLAVLAVPLTVITLAGGLFAVVSLDAARDARRAHGMAVAVEDLARLQQSVAAERALAVRAVATGVRVGDVRAARRTTDAALARATGSLRAVRGNPRPGAPAQLAAALRTVRRSVDQQEVSAGGVRVGYSAVTDIVTAVPVEVAARVGEDRLALPTAALAARLRAMDAVGLVQLAGDRVLWSGRSAGRAEYDELAGRRGVLERALADLALTAPAFADPGHADGLGGDPAVTDLERLTGGAPAQVGAAAWDGGAHRLVTRLRADLRAGAREVSGQSAAMVRTRTLLALGAVFTALGVVAGGLAHRVIARALGRREAQGARVGRHLVASVPRPRRPEAEGVSGWPFGPAVLSRSGHDVVSISES